MHVIEVPFHIGDFLSGTTHMDATEIGAYWMLCISHYQAGEQGLRDDDVRLARIAKVTPKTWKRIRPTLSEKFEITDGFWRHSKCIEILLKVSEKSSNAQAKALKRWGANDAAALPEHNHSNANHQTTKPPNQGYKPPLPPEAKEGVLKNGNGKGVFRIEHFLTDDAIMEARLAAPGWDIYNLMRVYDEGISVRGIPKHPEKAFPVWCGKYTKGKSP